MKKGCIWITGLSGAGKTTLAESFIAALGRPVTFLDGDAVRQTLCRDLGYSKADRDSNVERIAFVANEVVRAGGIAVVACISPYRDARQKARELIGDFFEVHMDNASRDIYAGEYEAGTADVTYSGDTANAVDLIDRLTQMGYLGTSFLLGRYQPWHDGHTALFKEALKEGKVCIGVRRELRDEMNFTQVKANIDRALAEYRGRYDVIEMPNITQIGYGRNVGYEVKRFELPADVEAISATKIRAATA